MIKKALILTLLLYFLTIFQSSVLARFSDQGYFFFNFFNLPLILVILINISEKPFQNLGIVAAFIGGFFLDFFSERFFGFWILISVLLSISIKFILRNYVRNPIFKRI